MSYSFTNGYVPTEPSLKSRIQEALLDAWAVARVHDDLDMQGRLTKIEALVNKIDDNARDSEREWKHYYYGTTSTIVVDNTGAVRVRELDDVVGA